MVMDKDADYRQGWLHALTDIQSILVFFHQYLPLFFLPPGCQSNIKTVLGRLILKCDRLKTPSYLVQIYAYNLLCMVFDNFSNKCLKPGFKSVLYVTDWVHINFAWMFSQI